MTQYLWLDPDNGGDWNDPNNWETLTQPPPVGPPGPGDDVVINLHSLQVITTDGEPQTDFGRALTRDQQLFSVVEKLQEPLRWTRELNTELLIECHGALTGTIGGMKAILDALGDAGGRLLKRDRRRQQACLGGQGCRPVPDDRQAVLGALGDHAQPRRKIGEPRVQQFLDPLARDRDRAGQGEPRVVERQRDRSDLVVAGGDRPILVQQHERTIA